MLSPLVEFEHTTTLQRSNGYSPPPGLRFRIPAGSPVPRYVHLIFLDSETWTPFLERQSSLFTGVHLLGKSFHLSVNGSSRLDVSSFASQPPAVRSFSFERICPPFADRMAALNLSLKAPLLLLLLVLAIVGAQEGGMAPSPAPAMENGSVGTFPGFCAVALASLVSFLAFLAH